MSKIECIERSETWSAKHDKT